jgi:exonuclease SbcC
MIKSLRLQNFQSHKSSTLEFSEGVNIILGSSDSGKTALIRALRKLFFNRPLGDSYISHWGGKMEIELFTDDAHIVYSKDKESEYVLGDTHFKAFSTDVPKEITDALNIGAENVQSQLDSPFLLSMTPGDIASHWNSIANLSKIDTGTQKVNSAIREITADIKYKEAQEVKLKDDLLTYQHISLFESEVQELEKLEKQSQTLDASFSKLYQWQASYYENKTKIEYFQKTLELEKPLNVILNLIEECAKKDVEQVKLDKLINQIQRIQVEIDEQKELLKAEKSVLELLQLHKDRDLLVDKQKGLLATTNLLRGIQDRINKENVLVGLESSVVSLVQLFADKKSAEDDQKKLSAVITSYRTVSERVVKGGIWIKTQEELFEKEMGDICKLCNQPIKHEHTN